MRIEKIQANILSASVWLTVPVLSSLLDADNSSSLLFQWKSEKKLFSVAFEGSEYYPLYALEVGTEFFPIKSLHPILIEFGSAKNG